MKYISTRGDAPELSFAEAMLTGLARDGGLYVPKKIPTMATEDIAALAGKSYEEVAFEVMKPFIGDSFTDEEFKGIIERAYAGFRHDARAPLVQLAPNHYLLELFHGPTLAFKDFAMQLIGQLFQFELERRERKSPSLAQPRATPGLRRLKRSVALITSTSLSCSRMDVFPTFNANR